MTLIDFVLARNAEDEAVAREATAGPWRSNRDGDVLSTDPEWCVVDTEGGANPPDVPDAEHIARYNPARVMAECDAKVRIVARYKGSEDAMNNQPDPLKRMVAGLIVETLLDVMKALALIWADHPDYQPEWKP